MLKYTKRWLHRIAFFPTFIQSQHSNGWSFFFILDAFQSFSVFFKCVCGSHRRCGAREIPSQIATRHRCCIVLIIIEEWFLFNLMGLFCFEFFRIFRIFFESKKTSKKKIHIVNNDGKKGSLREKSFHKNFFLNANVKRV